MKPSTRKQMQRRRVSQIVGLALLVSFCAMAVPLPMSVPTKSSSGKDESEPFPCQNRPCGCRTAEQCWKKCCCFTNSQKIAWAKANNVKVPEFVLTAAGIEAASVSAPRSGTCLLETAESNSELKSATSCCSKSDDVAAAVKDREPATSSGCCAKCVPKKAATHSKSRKKIVTGFNAAECQGIAFLVTMLSTSIVSANVSIESAVAMRDEMITAHSERLPLMSLRPPLPPPKIAA